MSYEETGGLRIFKNSRCQNEEMEERATGHTGVTGSPRYFQTRRLKVDATPIPTPLLHVCRRSRSVAQKSYQTAGRGSDDKPMYVDWKNDTILFEDAYAHWLFFGGLARRVPLEPVHKKRFKDWIINVQRLVIKPGILQEGSQRGYYLFQKRLELLKSLEELIILKPQDTDVLKYEKWITMHIPQGWKRESEGEEMTRWTRESRDELNLQEEGCAIDNEKEK